MAGDPLSRKGGVLRFLIREGEGVIFINDYGGALFHMQGRREAREKVIWDSRLCPHPDLL